MSPSTPWQRFLAFRCDAPDIGLCLDYSRMPVDDAFLDRMEPAIQEAFRAMDRLEAGDTDQIANPDEKRRVGHYWLRAPELAPTPLIAQEIRDTLDDVRRFSAEVHAGTIAPLDRARFRHLLLIGIGGSALGPMFVNEALGNPGTDQLSFHILDNTDPEGIARVLDRLKDGLSETLVLVISKSGGTPETRNGMLEAIAAFKAAGLHHPRHFVAVTGANSQLDAIAKSEGWLARFPMWDWVGGRTSQTSAVGLLPAALQGFDFESLLSGAAACDAITRRKHTPANPAAIMALMWHLATGGKGEKELVLLPYKDRLLLFSRYLQQLIMESLGKEFDLSGNRVEQGLTVFGNKGSTDQHAYVQQLRDGLNNFFVTFIRVLEDGGSNLEVEPGITSGDYLHGFLLGTREALSEKNRSSMTISIPRVDAYHVGVLIALFERAVGLYASLININAYHQPGVEAGKKAAAKVLSLQTSLASELSQTPRTATELATALASAEKAETIFLILEHLAANGRARRSGGADPASATFTSS